MIQILLLGETRILPSFDVIFETLKQHKFEIVCDVDTAEFCALVDWVEVQEQSGY
jgi:hypothetical protein